MEDVFLMMLAKIMEKHVIFTLDGSIKMNFFQLWMFKFGFDTFVLVVFHKL